MASPYCFPGRAKLQSTLMRGTDRVFLAGDFLGTLYTESSITTGFSAAQEAASLLATRTAKLHHTPSPGIRILIRPATTPHPKQGEQPTMSKQLKGVLTALATPFDQDGAIDVDTLRRIVDRSIDAGVDGVVAAGSTGEVGALSSEERLLLIDTVIKQAKGRVPVIAQTGATSTAEAIRLSQAAEKAGADVLMLITPYYEPLSLAETVTYIKDVARSVKLPVMLYNIPAVTGVNLDPATVRALAEEVENIRFIKDSSANWEQALQLIHHHGDVIGTFIGWDVYLYSAPC